jgi:hypothetical protein
MSEALTEALSSARPAHAAATEALLRAEDAARAAGVEGTAAIDELTVQRINVVEPDGTLRIVIGNSTHARLLPVRGRVHERAGRTPAAGLLFVNDEGTECGGLQYYGGRNEDGIEHGGYLTVDDYEQQESLRLGQTQGPDGSTKYVEYVDRPTWSLAGLVEEIEGRTPDEASAIQDRYAATEGYGVSRMRLSREPDGSVGLVLRDGEGRDRLRLVVPEDGEPVAEVVDGDGVSRSLLA